MCFTHTQTHTQEIHGWECTPWCAGVTVQESARLFPRFLVASPVAMWEWSGVQGKGFCLEKPNRHRLYQHSWGKESNLLYTLSAPFIFTFIEMKFPQVKVHFALNPNCSSQKRAGDGIWNILRARVCTAVISTSVCGVCVKWLVMLSLPWESLWNGQVSVTSRKPCLPKWEGPPVNTKLSNHVNLNAIRWGKYTSPKFTVQ